MRFSVVISTFNRRPLLTKCLEAVFCQEYPKNLYEVLVVDDGSTDDAREYLSSINRTNFYYFLESHNGPAKSRNFGIQKSKGEFIAFTDDDCLVPVNWLSQLEMGFNKWPQAAAVGGFLEASSVKLSKSPLARLEYFETHQIYKASDKPYLGGFESPAGGTNNIAYRRNILETLGGFDEGFPVPAGEDADLKLRVVKAGFKIGYWPIKVTHLDPYSLGSFWRRSYVSGIGSLYFARKQEKTLPSKSEILVSMFKDLLKIVILPIYFILGWLPQGVLVELLILCRSFIINLARFRYLKKI